MNRKKSIFYLAGFFLVICLCLIACKKNPTSGPNPPASLPQITSFAPANAPGGTSIVITGANFNTSITSNTVTVNGHAATVTAVNSSGTQLTATVPLRAGSGPVAVTVNNRTATSASSFSYEWVYTSVTTLAGSSAGAAGGSNGDVDSDFGSIVRFNKPSGIAVDTAGNIYVADSYNHKIRKVAPNGATRTLAGSGEGAFANGTGAAAKFYYPYGVAVDRNGNVYVADLTNNRIRKITPDGTTTTLAGSSQQGFADGDPAQVRFYNPTGVSVDANGNVYVADKGNHIIRKIAPNGVTSTLAGMAGNDNFGWVDNDNPDLVKFDSPAGVTVDAGGYVYVADAGNNRIRKVSPQGATTTLAGNGVYGYADHANGLAAEFRSPIAFTLGMNGDIYLTDRDNNRIRKITATGARAVSTVAGGDVGFLNHATDPLAAKFSTPFGVAMDKNGNLYVADKDNNCIRKITVQ